MTEIICGEIKYNNVVYCFDFRENILVLIPKKMENFLNWAGEHYNKNEKFNYINIEGTTNNGFYICFMHVKFSHIGRDCLKAFVPGYMICKSNCFSDLPNYFNIKKIRFYGECLDRFYYPKRAIKSNDYFKENYIKISMKKNVDTTNYQINYNKFHFGIDWKIPYNTNFNNVLELQSYLDIIFNKPIESVDELVNYYCNVEKFFAFINNRKYVKFNKILAYKTVEIEDVVEQKSNKTQVEFELFFNLPNEKIDLKKKYNSITLKSLGNKFPKIYKEIIKDEFLTDYYPLSKRDDSYIDNQKFLGVGSAFESEFNKCFPDFKSTVDKEYKKVKQSLLEYISSMKCLVSENNKKNNKYCDYFYKIIYNIDGTLQEKICFSLNRYKDIISFHEEILLHNYNVEKITFGKLSEEFIKRRNAISHGDFVGGFSDLEIIAYELLRICIYCITFERCGVDFKTIKFLIDRLFV